MVKLFALSVFYKTSTDVRLLKSANNLNKFWYMRKWSAKRFIRSTSRIIVQCTQQSSQQSIRQKMYMCHVHVREDGLSAVLVSDLEYSQERAHELINKVLDDFASVVPSDLWPLASKDDIYFRTLPAYLTKYQEQTNGI